MNHSKFALCALSLFSLSLLEADPAEKNHTMQTTPPTSPTKYLGNCHSFPIGGDAAIAFDFFRSLPDGSWGGNSGALASLNLATNISPTRYGVGVQLGGSYGIYDWSGQGSDLTANSKAVQQQGFITAGVFRVTPHSSGFNAGLVYDVMFNKSFGVFAVDPTVGQLRGQIGYLIANSNELGLWGTIDTQTAHLETSQIPLQFRAISQVNLFWTHSFKNHAHTTVWVGTPYRRGLMYTSGRAGNYVFGASGQAPLTKALSLVGHASYMGPHGGLTASHSSSNYAFNVSVGINYSFGGCKAGQRPYLDLANNTNFLIDTNLNQ